MSGEQEEEQTLFGRRPGKSAAAFRTISEVAVDLDVPTHVLRFWEGKFAGVKPLKRGGGRRYYRPEDVELLRRIRSLLYDKGYTIKGAQRVISETGDEENALPPASAPPPGKDDAGGEHDTIVRRELVDILRELRQLRELLGTSRP